MKYLDKKEVYLLSIAHTAENVNSGKRKKRTQKPIIKPAVVHDYMKGVDQFDQLLMNYNFNKKKHEMMEKGSHSSQAPHESASFLCAQYKRAEEAVHPEVGGAAPRPHHT